MIRVWAILSDVRRKCAVCGHGKGTIDFSSRLAELETMGKYAHPRCVAILAKAVGAERALIVEELQTEAMLENEFFTAMDRLNARTRMVELRQERDDMFDAIESLRREGPWRSTWTRS